MYNNEYNQYGAISPIYAGNDAYIGGAGNDNFWVGSGNDVINGGTGDDIVWYEHFTSGVNVDLNITTSQNTLAAGYDTLIDIEGLSGTNYNDKLTANNKGNFIQGLNGNDLIVAGGGNDDLHGDDGIDTISYALANAIVVVDLNKQSYMYSQNTYGSGNDVLTGFENVIGSRFNDTIIGDSKANVITGGLGDDLIDGAGGNDTASYESAATGVNVDLNFQYQLTIGAGNDFLYNIENLTGSNFNDKLTGNALANILTGGLGNDILDGGAGNDTMDGGAGNDTYYVREAGDKIIDSSGVDKVILSVSELGLFGAVEYEAQTGIENITIESTKSMDVIGNASANVINVSTINGANLLNQTIYGEGGNDTIIGGNGDDFLVGGLGDDIVIGGAGNDVLLGADQYNPLSEKDILNGGEGDDLYWVYESNTIIDSSGLDTVTLDWEYNANYILQNGLENLDILSNKSLISTGNEGHNNISAGMAYAGQTINGMGGNDEIFGSGKEDIIFGGSGNDTIFGGYGVYKDVIDGGFGNDNLNGGEGDDILDGGEGNDTIDGADGIDTVTYVTEKKAVSVYLDLNHGSISQVESGYGYDKIFNIENVTGSNFGDYIYGNAGSNTINGGLGDDFIVGRGGKDTLTGGGGKDVFCMDSMLESGTTATTRDVITDYVVGQDQLYLRAIDSNTLVAGHTEFKTITNIAGFNNVFTATAQLVFDKTTGILYGNNDADAQADFTIQLTGVQSLSAADLATF